MNFASTAAAPPAAQGFQAWSNSPNAYPVKKPEIVKETFMQVLSSAELGAIDDSQSAQFQNRTVSFTYNNFYSLGYGLVGMGTTGNVEVLRRNLTSTGNLEMAISQPTVVNVFVASGPNTTFNLPAASTPFRQDLADLRSIVSAIGQGMTFRRSPQFENLLDRALAKRGAPRDIDDWARRLAENVVNLDD